MPITYETRKYHFAVPSFPFAVIGVICIYQLIEKLTSGFSLSLALAFIFFAVLVWRWIADCTAFKKLPSITIDTDAIVLGDMRICWSLVKTVRFITRSLDPHIHVDFNGPYQRSDGETISAIAIPLRPYKHKFELMKTFKSCYEESHHGTTLLVPQRSSYVLATISAFAGSTLLIFGLMLAVGAIVWFYFEHK